MTTRSKLLIAGAMLVSVIAVAVLGPRLLFAWAVTRSFSEQGIQIRAAKPLFDAAVTSKLKVGDTLAHATEVLTYAGMTCDISKAPSLHEPQSIYRAGDGCGFHVKLEFGADDRITTITIQEYYTGP